MDRWDDDQAFWVARGLHGAPTMRGVLPTSGTANSGLALPPEAALDGLVETAWSFPGFRVSYAAFEGSRALRFHASAGSESQRTLDHVRLDLSDAPRLVEALRNADTPLDFEDVRADSRSRPIADALQQIDCRSMLLLPLFRERRATGVVMMDHDTPRTWGAREIAALDRLAPLMALTLEHVEARAELESTRTSRERHERRITALRGLTAGIAADAERIVTAMQATVDSDRHATQSLLGQLERVLAELERVQRSPSRISERFDLVSTIRELVPGLRAVTQTSIVFEDELAPVMGIEGNRTGLERLLVNLIVHASQNADRHKSLSLALEGDDEVRRIRLQGDALRIDDALQSMGGDAALITSAQVGATLWQVRCEALLQNIHLRVEGEAIVLDCPAVDLAAVDTAKSAG